MKRHRKRRAFRGTEAEHRSLSKNHLRSAKRDARMVRRALARGDCHQAIIDLAGLAWNTGAYVSERYWSGNRKGKPMQAGADRTLSSLSSKVWKTCKVR